MRNAGLEEEQAGIQIAGRNINNLRFAWVVPVHQPQASSIVHWTWHSRAIKLRMQTSWRQNIKNQSLRDLLVKFIWVPEV